MKIWPKNWREFQHYKDRSPGWIKLHKNLLDDYDFHSLPVASRALAPCLWLLASEADISENGEIKLDINKVAFRVRIDANSLVLALMPLIEKGFFIASHDASELLADLYQAAILEKRREREEIETYKPEKEKSSQIAKLENNLPVAAPLAPKKDDVSPEQKYLRSKTWEAYATAFFNRHKTEPVRNAKTNAQIVQIVKNLGEEAPHVAAFYLTHNEPWYVKKMHSLDSLVKDAESLRAQWATGKMVTGKSAMDTLKFGGMADAINQHFDMDADF